MQIPDEVMALVAKQQKPLYEPKTPYSMPKHLWTTLQRPRSDFEADDAIGTTSQTSRKRAKANHVPKTVLLYR
jgi:hypothetical protein